jgi:hypothetical protein
MNAEMSELSTRKVLIRHRHQAGPDAILPSKVFKEAN